MTANRDLIVTANTTADELGALCAELAHGLLQRITEAQGGLAAARPERIGTRGVSLADPTAVSAMRGLDLAAAHRNELEHCIGRARTAIHRALDIAAGYPEPREPDAGARAALSRLNDHSDPGCESCARVAGPAGGPRWEPPDARLDGHRTDACGALDRAMWLCRWCHDAVRRWGRLPTLAELERHHDGKRVPWPADVERPA